MNSSARGLIKRVILALITVPAVCMPYRVRLAYIQGLSALLHAPYRLFGTLARYLLDQLNIREKSTHASPPTPPVDHTNERKLKKVAVLFSGGTDSMCAAALTAEHCDELHLLTYFEHATRRSPSPTENVTRLQKHFPAVRITHALLSVDTLVRHFSYERYLQTLRIHGLLVLATPGFSSLSWHTRTIAYCLDNGITHVRDGLTRELMQFPGHMDGVVELFKTLYARYGITYESPVRDWQTPPDRQFIDQVLVNTHGEFLLGDRSLASHKTTGRYLYERGILPSPNVKGSPLDFSMQHDCYPFALYNILSFWGFLTVMPYPLFAEKVRHVMMFKVDRARTLLDGYRDGTDAGLASMIH